MLEMIKLKWLKLFFWERKESLQMWVLDKFVVWSVLRVPSFTSCWHGELYKYLPRQIGLFSRVFLITWTRFSPPQFVCWLFHFVIKSLWVIASVLFHLALSNFNIWFDWLRRSTSINSKTWYPKLTSLVSKHKSSYTEADLLDISDHKS